MLKTAGLLLLMCGIGMAQTRDPRVDDLLKQTDQLKRTIADQGARIAELERIVKTLQSAAPPLPARIPAQIPPWHRASNWSLVKTGMSEAQVTELLGPPTSVDTSIDTRTLLYTPDSHSTSTLKGSVTLTGDRVVAMVPPAF